MMAPTHIAAGLLTTTGVFSLFSTPLHNNLPAIGATILGSLLPDVDSPRSSLGRLVPFISVPLERKWGHRTITHCLLAVAVLAVILSPLLFFHGAMFAALLIGYMSHLLADCATKSGCPLFLPRPEIAVLPGNDRYRIHTGSAGEMILLAVLVLLLAAVFPLSRMGGIWRAMRYLAATPSAAYSDYREAITETVLNFKGHWHDSRQPVSGDALILDATKSRFLIVLNGQVVSYGETGDILPDRSRVRATGRPIRIDTLTIQGNDHGDDQGNILGNILGNIPANAFISGRLKSSVPFTANTDDELPQLRHQSVQISDHALDFDYAPRTIVAHLRPRRKIEPNRITQLQQQIQDLHLELDSQSIKQPPVHYLQLRETQTRLHDKERQLADLQDTIVVFTGILSIRVPSAQEL